MKKKKLYKVYVEGGQMSKSATAASNTAMFGQIAGMSAGIMDGFAPKDHVPSVGFSAAKGALSGAAAGAQFGPWGALIGGVAGGAMGTISGAAAKKEEKIQSARSLDQERKDAIARGQAAIAADPTLTQGNRNVDYYASGGNLQGLNQMNGQQQLNGALRPVSFNNTVVDGPSHANGGVMLPGMQAELEGGETTAGTRVYSKDLGFADLHKPIAKAIGKIETKPPTMERINALGRLRMKEDRIYQAQELLKMLNQQ